MEKTALYFRDLWEEWRPKLDALERRQLAATTAWTCGVAAAAAVGLYCLYGPLRRRRRRNSLRRAIAAKRADRNREIDQLRNYLRSEEIVERRRRETAALNFEQLRQHLQDGSLTAVQAIEAYLQQALNADRQTNCVCEFLPEAIGWASEMDQKFDRITTNQQDAKPLPLLFGVPISLKESMKLIGHDATVGFAQFVGQPATDEATLTTVLRQAGAVPFVTTNLPQSMLSLGSSNPVYGLTSNPNDPMRSSGGSSSGEGALIALRGSPLGVGTDVGGSVRVPAHWCGICALKPSVGRLCQGGRRGAVPGQSSLRGTAGPMGPDVASLAWFMRAVCAPDSPMWRIDPYVLPLPFDEHAYSGHITGPLTIGYYDNDNWLRPMPACSRAVRVAKQLLEAAGHRLVKLQFPFDRQEMHRLVARYTASLLPDGGRYLLRLCHDDLVDVHHRQLIDGLLAGRPSTAHGRTSERMRTIFGAFAKNTDQQRAIFADVDDYRRRFVQFWTDNGLDAVVCPVSVSTPLPLDMPSNLFVYSWMYTALYNLLDFPAGVVPCTHVTPDDEQAALTLDPEGDPLLQQLYAAAEGTVGLPVGVQCVTLPYKEELCLRVMKDIETTRLSTKR